MVKLSGEPWWWTLVLNLINKIPVQEKGAGESRDLRKKSRDFWSSLVPGPQDHGTFKVSRSCPVLSRPSRDFPGQDSPVAITTKNILPGRFIEGISLCSLRSISYLGFIRVRSENQFFLWKILNADANCWEEITSNFRPICPIVPKVWDIFENSTYRASVVRGQDLHSAQIYTLDVMQCYKETRLKIFSILGCRNRWTLLCIRMNLAWPKFDRPKTPPLTGLHPQ